MSVTFTNDARFTGRTQGTTLERAGYALLSIAVLAFVAALTVFVRVFIFEYFHGDPRPLQDLYWLLAGLPAL